MNLDLNLRSNTVWAIAEVIASAVFLFVLYRLVVLRLGVEALGLWSVVLATTSLVRLVDPGAGSGIGRFIALAHGRGDTQRMSDFFITALLSTLVFYGTLGCAVFGPLWEGLRYAVKEQHLAEARGLLPYAMASFLLMNFNGVVQGALVGVQRSDLKSKLAIFCLALQLALALVLVPSRGLIGVAEAQIAQYCVAVALGYLIVLRMMFGRYLVNPSYHWSISMLSELWQFGIKLQALSIVSFLYEPFSKFAVSAFGGLELLGLYEMAQKLVLQARQIVVGPTTVLMPAFTKINDLAPVNMEPLYRQSLATIVAFGAMAMAAAAMLSPLIGYFWIGRFDERFIALSCVMSLSWFVNIVGAPSYLVAIATTKLGWNFWGAFVTSAGSPILAAIAGHALSSQAAAFGAILALGLGSFLSLVMNCRNFRLPAWPSLADLKHVAELITLRLRRTPKPSCEETAQ